MEKRGQHTYLTYDGDTMTLTEWTRDPRSVVKSPSTLATRVHKLGMSDERALTEPIGTGMNEPLTLTYDGDTKTIAEWMRDPRCVVSRRTTILSRLDKGWSVEKALTYPVRQVQSDRSLVEAWGEHKTIAEWVADDRCTVSEATLTNRLRRNGVAPEVAISTPRGRLGAMVYAFGKSLTPQQWAAEPVCRVNADTLRRRLNSGMRPEEAITAPSLKASEMTLDQRFADDVRCRTALEGKQFDQVPLVLLREGAAAVKDGHLIEISNKYEIGLGTFALGVWSPLPQMLAWSGAVMRAASRNVDVRLLHRLFAAAQRQEQGSGDLYRFPGWFAVDDDGAVWMG